VDTEVVADVPEGLAEPPEVSRLFDLVSVQGGIATPGSSTVHVVQNR
jgi:hypothetical protein